jgi:hypothetical protein
MLFLFALFILCDAGAKASTDGDKTETDVQHGSIEGLLAMSFCGWSFISFPLSAVVFFV